MIGYGVSSVYAFVYAWCFVDMNRFPMKSTFRICRGLYVVLRWMIDILLCKIVDRITIISVCSLSFVQYGRYFELLFKNLFVTESVVTH